MQDADIVAFKAEYAVGVSADILYAPVPYMVNDEDVVYVVAQESEQFFPVRDGLFGLFLELVKKEGDGQDNQDQEEGADYRRVDGKGRLLFRFKESLIGKIDDYFDGILDRLIGRFNLCIEVREYFLFRI